MTSFRRKIGFLAGTSYGIVTELFAPAKWGDAIANSELDRVHGEKGTNASDAIHAFPASRMCLLMQTRLRR